MAESRVVPASLMRAQRGSDFVALGAKGGQIGRKLVELPQRAYPHERRQLGCSKNHLRKADRPRKFGLKALLFPAESERAPMCGAPRLPCEDRGIRCAIILHRGRSRTVEGSAADRHQGGRENVPPGWPRQTHANLRISHDPSSKQLDCGQVGRGGANTFSDHLAAVGDYLRMQLFFKTSNFDGALNVTEISPAQCRGARGMLGWSQAELAAAAQVSRPTIVDFERGVRVPHAGNLASIIAALEQAGIEFTPRERWRRRCAPSEATDVRIVPHPRQQRRARDCDLYAVRLRFGRSSFAGSVQRDRSSAAVRLEALLQSVIDRRVKADAEVQARIDELSRERTTAEDKLRRLYQLVADGIAEPDEMLKEQIAKLKADRERAHSALERIENQGAAQAGLIRTSLPASGSSCAQTSQRARCRSAKPICAR